MDTWLIAVLGVLGALVLILLVIPIVSGMVYRCCTRTVQSAARLDGKTVIVTGASGGIGIHTAKFMASRGARVIMACRNARKAQPIADSIIQETGNANVVVKVVDLADMDSVRDFATNINDTEERLDILINNGGMVAKGPKQTSPQGFELTMATNHYGPFLLTMLLIEKLKRNAPSRVVILSSTAHLLNILDINDLHYEKRTYGNVRSYCQSKLCNLLFTRELARRLHGTGVTANCLHPGVVATELFNKGGFSMMDIMARTTARTPAQGANTTCYLAVSEEVAEESGHYYNNCRKWTVRRKAADDKLAKQLWDVTCRDVGIAKDVPLPEVGCVQDTL